MVSSLVRDRTQTVVINSQRSKTSLVTNDDPQDSVLGPILFLLYTADIGLIAEKHGINFHSYTDDSKLYVHCKAHDAAVTCSRIVSCIRDIDNWMASNWLKLNPDKTQFIILGSRQQLAKVNCDSIHLDNADIPFSLKVNCLGVILDAELTMLQHIRGLTGRCFYQLRQIRAIQKSLTVETVKLLVHTFVNSRLNYCNSILQGVSAVHLQKLQTIQKGAAWIVARRRKFDPITSTIRDELHWLPIVKRIHFKQCMLVYRSVHGMAPSYIADMCVKHSFESELYNLCSAVRGELVVPLARKSTLGSRRIKYSGSSLWNALPHDS